MRHANEEFTCRIGPDEYTKHFLGLSDNVPYFAEQLETADVSVYHQRITFKPQAIIPDADFRGSTRELLENASGFNQCIGTRGCLRRMPFGPTCSLRPGRRPPNALPLGDLTASSRRARQHGGQ